MTQALLACPKCKTGLSAETFNTLDFTACPGCGVPIEALVFPAFFRPPAVGQTGETILVEGESSCFYHPQKRAAVPCESCGRFLCALCDVELNGQHLCPRCVESGKREGKIRHLQNQRVLYDDIAAALSTFPLLLWPLTCLTAPMALYIAIRYWNAPSSLIPRSKVRFVVAILLASLQVLGWAALIGAFLNR